MPRQIIVHDTSVPLNIDAAKRRELEAWLAQEVQDAFSARAPLEAQWREDMRSYEGIPRQEVSDFPIENAPNIELTLAAIAADSLYAQAVDLIFSTSPLITCRGMPKRKNDKITNATVKALQRFINWLADNEAKLRAPVEEFVLDNTQLGTGVLYSPWVERTKKTKSATVIARHPTIRCVPIEDCLVAGGSYADIEELRWLALRFWLTMPEVVQRGAQNGWDVDGVQSAGARDWVRSRREVLGRQTQGISALGSLYDIYDIYCFYDIDGDGVDEDLYVVYNHTGQTVLKIAYNPFDRRPIEKAVYQRRAHLFYGLGTVRMMKPYQEHMTDFFNWAALNALLANCRMWATKEGVVPDNLRIWPNKQIPCKDPQSDIQAIQMSEVYPSSFQLMGMLSQFAERRVGVNETSMPRGGQMGSRTPGITAITMMQQVNKRFVPAFDGMRNAVAGALKQCVYRYQERLLAGDVEAETHILMVLGPEDGQLVVNLLNDQSFDEHITIELTASSSMVNRESDRQNAIMLVNLLSQYYQRTLELVGVASNPQTPEAIREVAKKIAESSSEIIDRTIRTFDTVRDPGTFIIEIEGELDKVISPQGGIQGLLAMLTGGGEQGGQQPSTLPPGGGQ